MQNNLIHIQERQLHQHEIYPNTTAPQSTAGPSPTNQAQQHGHHRPKSIPGTFVYARLPFLDSRVCRSYGCRELLKQGGVMPRPPNDLVLTTRIHRKYFKDGQLQM